MVNVKRLACSVPVTSCFQPSPLASTSITNSNVKRDSRYWPSMSMGSMDGWCEASSVLAKCVVCLSPLAFTSFSPHHWLVLAPLSNSNMKRDSWYWLSMSIGSMDGWCEASSVLAKCVVCLSPLAFSPHHWLALLSNSNVKRKPSASVFPASTISISISKPSWQHTKYWKPCSIRLSYRGLRGLAPRHVMCRPTRMWIRHGADAPDPQLWINSPTALWVPRKDNFSKGSNLTQEILSGATKAMWCLLHVSFWQLL